MLKNIQVGYDASKLKALNQYMDKKEITLQSELEGYLDKLYEKYVPMQVREFIESLEKESTNKKQQHRKKEKDEVIENTSNYG